jgi:hypothetical protein
MASASHVPTAAVFPGVAGAAAPESPAPEPARVQPDELPHPRMHGVDDGEVEDELSPEATLLLLGGAGTVAALMGCVGWLCVCTICRRGNIWRGELLPMQDPDAIADFDATAAFDDASDFGASARKANLSGRPRRTQKGTLSRQRDGRARTMPAGWNTSRSRHHPSAARRPGLAR